MSNEVLQIALTRRAVTIQVPSGINYIPFPGSGARLPIEGCDALCRLWDASFRNLLLRCFPSIRHDSVPAARLGNISLKNVG
jgi:hypothetical protein